MPRQLKNFLKQKKGMWKCGECKCLTLNAWRCSDEFCGCGGESNNAVPQPPVPSPAPSPAPAPTPIDPDDNNQTPDDNDNEPDYISLDDLNS